MFFNKIKNKFIKKAQAGADLGKRGVFLKGPTTDKSILDDWANTKTVEGFMSVIDILPNPDVVLKNAGKRLSVLRTLTNHYQVGTCIDSRKAGTLSNKWELRENNCNKAHFDFYDEIFKTIDIYKLIEDILDAPLYGHNPIEISYEKDGSYIIPVKLTSKPQEWFHFNSDGEFFFKDKNMDGKRLIDFENGLKFLLPRHKATFQNPHGQAILSRCFWNVAFINGGMEFLVKFAEHFGMPWIFGRYQRQLSEPEQKDFLYKLMQMAQNAIGIIPDDSRVEIVPTGSTGSSDIHLSLVNKCEANIAKSILGQTLSTESGQNGSYALGKAHMGVRDDIINADMRLVEKTVNHFIKIINSINFNDDEVPEFAFVEDEDLGIQKAERDIKVSSLGVEFSEEYILKTYGYQKDDIKIVPKQTNLSGINFSDAEDEDNSAHKAPESKDFFSAENLEKQITPALNPIIEFFEKNKNAEEALEKLAEVYPDLNTEELEEMLTKVIFISELKGRLDIQEHRKRMDERFKDGN